MKYRHPCWATLEIEPISDPRAIRVAYTRKLKAIDPETDPQAFIALREAYDAAQVQAQWVDLPEDEDDEDYDWDDESWSGAPAAGYSYNPITGTATPLANSGPEWQRPEPAPRGIAINEPVSGPRFDPSDGGADPVPLPGGPAPEVRSSPWGGLTPEQANAHASALANLLHSFHGQSNWPTPEQNQEMLAHWEALSSDPQLQEVAYFADAERWFSNLVAQTSPVSDPLVGPVTRFFGWLASDGTIGQSWAIAAVTQRYRMLEFMEAVQQRSHPLNAAWRELVRPASEGSWRGFVGRRKVRDLLSITRRDFPDLEGCFDSYRVSLWENAGSGDGGFNLSGWVAPTLFVLFLLVRACTAIDSSPPPPVYAPPVEERANQMLEHIDAGLDAILEERLGGGIDMAAIAKFNPPLAGALKSLWIQYRGDFSTQSTLGAEVNARLRASYVRAVREGNADLLRQYHRLTIDVARTLRRSDPGQCMLFLDSDRTSDGGVSFTEQMLARERTLMIRVLLGGPSTIDANTPDRSFMIPGEVIADASRRAGLSDAQMRKAIGREGSMSHQCVGNIALMEAILDLPRKQGLPLMRKL